MPSETDKWGWKHVSIYGGFDKGGGTKRWKCNHCNLRYNGSYSRVRAHLLGFTGVGVKSCPAIDRSLREAFQVLEEERLSKKKKTISVGRKPGQRIQTCQKNLNFPSKEDVDNLVARFFIADGSNLCGVDSPYFHEMVKAIAAFGPGYEPPTANALSTSFLNKERAKIDRYVALVRESWSHTGCTVLCIGHAHRTLGYLRIDILISSSKGLVFLKQVDVNCIEEMDNLLTSVLSDVIKDVGPSNVFQIISHLDHPNKYFSSLILQKYPHIFWSPCTSHSIRMLMEEIAEFGSMKPVILCTREIEQYMVSYQPAKCMLTQTLRGNPDPLSSVFAPSYAFVQKIFELKQSLQEVVVSEEWKQWKHHVSDDIQNIESAILGDEYWNSANLYLKLCEPFIKSLLMYNVDKFVMGDACDWRIQAFGALKSKGINGHALNQIDQLIESKWDVFFSPLHAAGYILNPRYFGKGQAKDKIVMRGWKVTLEKYQSEITGRRVLREQLSSYWRSEGSFGDEDAIYCRDKIDPVAWWENFGFETPELQALAVKVLSQVSNVESCQGIWHNDDFPNCQTSNKFGVERGGDLVFVKNNLRLSVLQNGIANPLSGQRSVDSDPSPGFKTLDIVRIDQPNETMNIHDKF